MKTAASSLTLLHKDALARRKGDVILDVLPPWIWIRVTPRCIGDACNVVPHLLAARSPPPLLRKREGSSIAVLHRKVGSAVGLLDAL